MAATRIPSTTHNVVTTTISTPDPSVTAQGGTVARALSAHLAGQLGVVDLGATGVGDETEVVQAAVNAAVARGLTELRVSVPTLTVSSGSAAGVDCKGLRLRCQGTELVGSYHAHGGIIGGTIKGYPQDRAQVFPRPERTRTRPVFVQQTGLNSAWVIVWKDGATDHEYLLLSMLREASTVNESEAGSAALWRLGTVADFKQVFVFLRGSPTVSGSWSTLSPSTSLLAPNGNQPPSYWRSATPGDFIEWTGITGTVVSVGSLSSATPALTEVLVDGVLVGSFVNAQNAGQAQVVHQQYRVTPGTHTVRVRHAGAAGQNCHVFGPNFFHLKDAVPGLAYDRLWYGRNDATNPAYMSNTGANDYAIYNHHAGTWAGSYHGGETALAPAAWKLDGVPVPILTEAPGADWSSAPMYVGRALSIDQQTQISWAARPQDSLTTRARTDFHDGGLSFACVMRGAGNLVARTFFTHMTKADPIFSRVTFPAEVDTNDLADPRRDAQGYYSLGRINKLVQQHPASGRTITSWWTLFPFEVSTHGGAIVWDAGASYRKLYYGPIESPKAPAPTVVAFESTWVFA